jgi:hypothetical protein
MPLTHPSRKLGTEKDVHLTYESCMASLHATGKPLMKRLPPVRCGGCISLSAAPPSVQLCTDTCARQTNRTVLSFCTIVSHDSVFSWCLLFFCTMFLLRYAFLLSENSCRKQGHETGGRHHQPWIVPCRCAVPWRGTAARLLQPACARQTNSTHGFAHPNPNPTTAGQSNSVKYEWTPSGFTSPDQTETGACDRYRFQSTSISDISG